MDMIHGGDIAGFTLRYGQEPLDFSASLNPLGMPAGVAAAAQAAVLEAAPYPDPLCRRLRAALGQRYGVDAAHIVCGNGAADVIYRLVLALRPRRALIPIPTFVEYEQALRLVECDIDRHRLDPANGFRLDEGILEKITPGLDLLFLCQPNNPTGHVADPALVRSIVDRARKCGARVMVDECFLALTNERERHTLVPTLARQPHLVVLDSFTKLYAMAGLRLGFGLCGDAALAQRLHAAGQPWSVSHIAQAAGLAALAEDGYVDATLRAVADLKARLRAGLEKRGYRCFGSAANYVFFASPRCDLADRLAALGILIRDCRTFQGLEAGYYRVAVRPEAETARLFAALDALTEG